MKYDKNLIFRNFPSVQEILENKALKPLIGEFPYNFVKDRLNTLLKQEKNNLLKLSDSGQEIDYGERFKAEYFAGKLKDDLSGFSFSLRRVVNGTGVIIHTNLGRSILPDSAVKNVAKISSSYSNLEFNLSEGKRGKRYSHVDYLLQKISGCENSIVVNNNAAAVFMALSSFCGGQKKEVIVSRGELVEIGGSFRIPDIMTASGAILAEVGTTNKTRPSDYEKNINENTALLLKVHHSNFKMSGFTSEPSGRDIAAIGKKHNIPVMEDLGSGSFIDMERFGLPHEPTVQDVIESGVDIVTFSGDKLLGGPQAGIISGKKEYVDLIAANPLNRAFRIDKMTLAALEAVLFEYLDTENAIKRIPALFLLSQKSEDIKKKALKLLNKIKKSKDIVKDLYAFKIVEDFSLVGGGALPDYKLKTFSIGIKHNNLSAHRLGQIFRDNVVPLLGKIKNDEFLIDMRTVLDFDFQDIIQALSLISKQK